MNKSPDPAARAALIRRVLTALCLIPPVLAMVWYGPASWVATAFGLVILLGAWEWSALAGCSGRSCRLAVTGLLAALLVLATLMSLTAQTWVIRAGAGFWILAVLAVVLIQVQAWQLPQSRVFKLICGILVLIPAWLAVVHIHGSGPRGPALLLVLLLVVWAADIAAFFAGRRWGKKPLVSRISPGKTREGAWGAVVACLLIGILAGLLLGTDTADLVRFTGICLATAAISIIGDLFESLMKRGASLKDSGHLLPGHGGILDRIDSLTAAAPVYLFALQLTGVLA